MGFPIKKQERVLFFHGESDCYFVALGEKAIAEAWAADDGCLADVTGVAEHEEAAKKRCRCKGFYKDPNCPIHVGGITARGSGGSVTIAKPATPRGRAVAESLLVKTTDWLTEDLGLEVPKHPTDEMGKLMQPSLPSDITRSSIEEIGRLYGQFVAMYQYASAQLGLVDVEHTESDYETKYEEAMAGFRAEGSATERKLSAQTAPAVVAKERDRVVKKAKRALLSQLVTGYEQGFKCLSRELTRRGIEREEK